MWQNMPKYYGKQLAKYEAVLKAWRGE
jgi:hypothetical protein